MSIATCSAFISTLAKDTANHARAEGDEVGRATEKNEEKKSQTTEEKNQRQVQAIKPEENQKRS